MIDEQPKEQVTERIKMTGLSDMERGYKTAELLIQQGDLQQFTNFITEQAQVIIRNRSKVPRKQFTIQRADGDTGPIVGATQEMRDDFRASLDCLVGATCYASAIFFGLKDVFPELKKRFDEIQAENQST